MRNPKKRILVSICVPVLNEATNISILLEEVSKVFRPILDRYQYEVIFTDNNSSDETWSEILRLRKLFTNIRAYKFTKNIGFQHSILYNFKMAHGDVAIQLDADLQDPPHMILDFLDQWEKGYKVVYGKRVSRDEGFLLQKFRNLGYLAINYISEDKIPVGGGDFRLLDRKVLDILASFKSPEPYLRGIVASLGFEAKAIPYRRKARQFGKSKFNLLKIIRLGISGVLNHSKFSSKIASVTAILSISGSLALAASLTLNRILSVNPLPGWTFLSILILIGIGINATMFWLLNHRMTLIYGIVAVEPKIIVSDEVRGSFK